MNSWTITALNIFAWLGFHLGWAWLATLLPLHLFPPEGRVCHLRSWEVSGRVYDRCFCIKRWKHLLPEGADLLGTGFRKARLERRDSVYLQRFYRETCRAEFAHWWVLLCGPLFFFWNPAWAGWVMVAYGLLVNLPCILTQRYNRIRLDRVLTKRGCAH